MNYVPYWLQLLIWPFIRSTACSYCHFIRGFGLGMLFTAFVGGIAWLLLRP